VGSAGSTLGLNGGVSNGDAGGVNSDGVVGRAGSTLGLSGGVSNGDAGGA
jgi:hypothetical protein